MPVKDNYMTGINPNSNPNVAALALEKLTNSGGQANLNQFKT
jgi:hypothetical protein